MPKKEEKKKEGKRKGKGPHGQDLLHTEVRVGYVTPNKKKKVLTEEGGS
jgi:hypothetical protein